MLTLHIIIMTQTQRETRVWSEENTRAVTRKPECGLTTGITGTSQPGQPGPSPPASDAIGEEVQTGVRPGLRHWGQQELAKRTIRIVRNSNTET